MKRRSVDIYDSDISCNSIIKNKGLIQSSKTNPNDNMNNTKDISQDLKDHFKTSKFEHLNDTLNDILMSMMRKEEKMLDFSRNRDSILHNIQLKNVETARNSSTKARKRNTSIDSQQSLSKNMNINFVRNSCERSRKDLYINRSPNASIVTNHHNRSFYEREMINLEKKKLEIEAIKNQRRADEMIINTNRPQLSENSQKIINEKFKSQKPVYLRTADIIQMKKIEESKLLQNNFTKLTENNDINQTLSRKKTPIKSKNLESEDSPVTRWLKKMELYNAIQDKKMEKNKLCNEQGKKEAESYSFKPIISKTSDLLAKMKLSSDGNNLNKSTHERLHEDKENRSKKLEKLIDDNMPSFSPVINRHKQNYFYNGKISRRSLSKYLTQNEAKEKKHFDKTKSGYIQYEIVESNKKNLKNDSVNMNVNEVNFNDFDVNTAGYKINIRNYSAWVKEKENNIVLTKAIPNTLKSLYFG